jgi:hypothetical protein
MRGTATKVLHTLLQPPSLAKRCDTALHERRTWLILYRWSSSKAIWRPRPAAMDQPSRSLFPWTQRLYSPALARASILLDQRDFRFPYTKSAKTPKKKGHSSWMSKSLSACDMWRVVVPDFGGKWSSCPPSVAMGRLGMREKDRDGPVFPSFCRFFFNEISCVAQIQITNRFHFWDPRAEIFKTRSHVDRFWDSFFSYFQY